MPSFILVFLDTENIIRDNMRSQVFLPQDIMLSISLKPGDFDIEAPPHLKHLDDSTWDRLRSSARQGQEVSNRKEKREGTVCHPCYASIVSMLREHYLNMRRGVRHQ